MKGHCQCQTHLKFKGQYVIQLTNELIQIQHTLLPNTALTPEPLSQMRHPRHHSNITRQSAERSWSKPRKMPPIQLLQLNTQMMESNVDTADRLDAGCYADSGDMK
jgi:hypothetical protein